MILTSYSLCEGFHIQWTTSFGSFPLCGKIWTSLISLRHKGPGLQSLDSNPSPWESKSFGKLGTSHLGMFLSLQTRSQVLPWPHHTAVWHISAKPFSWFREWINGFPLQLLGLVLRKLQCVLATKMHLLPSGNENCLRQKLNIVMYCTRQTKAERGVGSFLNTYYGVIEAEIENRLVCLKP